MNYKKKKKYYQLGGGVPSPTGPTSQDNTRVSTPQPPVERLDEESRAILEYDQLPMFDPSTLPPSGAIYNTFGPMDYIAGAFPIGRVLGPAARYVGQVLGLGKKAAPKPVPVPKQPVTYQEMGPQLLPNRFDDALQYRAERALSEAATEDLVGQLNVQQQAMNVIDQMNLERFMDASRYRKFLGDLEGLFNVDPGGRVTKEAFSTSNELAGPITDLMKKYGLDVPPSVTRKLVEGMEPFQMNENGGRIYKLGGRFSGVTGPNVLPEAEVTPSNLYKGSSTRQDSAAAYSASQKTLDDLRKEGYTEEIARKDMGDRFIMMDHGHMSMDDHMRHMRGEFNEAEKAAYNKYIAEGGQPGGGIYAYFGIPSRGFQGDGMIYARPQTPHVTNARVGYNPDIQPENVVIMQNPETGAIISVPVNPKPSDPKVKERVVRTATQNPLRVPVPGMFTQTREVAPEPLPMRGAMQIPTEERDMSLRPMQPIKSTGRQPRRVMRPNPRMRTGQEPNYDVIWDDRRKQYVTRPIEPEELEYYRRQNRIQG